MLANDTNTKDLSHDAQEWWVNLSQDEKLKHINYLGMKINLDGGYPNWEIVYAFTVEFYFTIKKLSENE